MAELSPPERLECTQDAARDAWLAWDRFANAGNSVMQASAIVDLSNAMSDLVSWLPGYDPEIGRLNEEES